jgi:hypothetical protein
MFPASFVLENASAPIVIAPDKSAASRLVHPEQTLFPKYPEREMDVRVSQF